MVVGGRLCGSIARDETARDCGLLRNRYVILHGSGYCDVPTVPLVRTAEYFGSGAQADQRVLISQDLARALTAGGVRGAELKPVTEPEPR